jgi:hypothetical protein
MDAAEFFQEVVRPNYEEFCRDQNQLRRLWNEVVSMNTVAEYVALDRLGYEELEREELGNKANEIRNGNPILRDLKVCAETLKHVRKLERKALTEFSSLTSSTGLLSNQPTTWIIDYKTRRYVLSYVLHGAFNALTTFPEFTR